MADRGLNFPQILPQSRGWQEILAEQRILQVPGMRLFRLLRFPSVRCGNLQAVSKMKPFCASSQYCSVPARGVWPGSFADDAKIRRKYAKRTGFQAYQEVQTAVFPWFAACFAYADLLLRFLAVGYFLSLENGNKFEVSNSVSRHGGDIFPHYIRFVYRLKSMQACNRPHSLRIRAGGAVKEGICLPFPAVKKEASWRIRSAPLR